jgi:two-component system, sensor histidine kinase
MLSSLSKRLHATRTFEEAIATILDDIIALHGAEYGNVQLPIGHELAIVAQRGLTEAFLKAFKRVKKGDGCACGRALRLRRTVVIRDVEEDVEFSAFLKDARAAAFRAVQSTPFFTSDGLLLGIVSTHFANVHEPTPIEIKTLQSYSVVAAEHAYQLLGNEMLATKAAQMSETLYASLYPNPGVGGVVAPAADPSSMSA